MKVSLFLMTFKGYQVLKTIISANLINSIDVVIVGLDKSVENDYSSEIISLCKEFDVDFYYSNDKFKIDATYAIAVSWRWIIQLEKTSLIVLHDSILPKYRGFAPLVNALINKEKSIGVTAIFASDNYDTGPIISQRQIPLLFPIKINEAIESISLLYNEIIIEILKKIDENISLNPLEQNEDEATYSLWLDSEDYFINWNDSAEKIERFINAVGFPYQGAKCLLNDAIVVIKSAVEITDVKIENRVVGKVIFTVNNNPVIVCGKGLLRIDQAEFETTKKNALPLNKFRTRFK